MENPRLSRISPTMFSRLSMSTALSTVNTFPTFDNYPICSMFQIRGTIPSSFERKIIELARKLPKISVSISKRKRKRRDNFWKFYKKKKNKKMIICVISHRSSNIKKYKLTLGLVKLTFCSRNYQDKLILLA